MFVQLQTAIKLWEVALADNNFLIDAFTTMQNAKNEEESWTSIHGILNIIGASHLVAGKVAKKDKSILWVRTSMKDSWMKEYIDQQYYSIDPIIKQGLTQSTTVNIVCGDMLIGDENHCDLELECNLGLKDAGYGELRAQTFTTDDRETSRISTICFDDHKDILENINDVHVGQVQSLMSVFLSKPISEKSPGLVKLGAHMLSGRERDVLAYLSQGMMTAKIAEKLGLAEVTVNKHFNSGKKRLGASTREQALAIAMASGAISL